jgi:hypothetical protein
MSIINYMKQLFNSAFLIISAFGLFVFSPKVYASPCTDQGYICVADTSNECTDKGGAIIDTMSCDTVVQPVCCNLINVIRVEMPPVPKKTIPESIIEFLVPAVFVIAGLIAFTFLIGGGIQWITSGKNKAGVKAAQKRIQVAFVGLIIIVASWVIISLVVRFLGIKTLTP